MLACTVNGRIDLISIHFISLTHMSADGEVMGTCTCHSVELYREHIEGRALGYRLDSQCIHGYLLCALLLDYNPLRRILLYEPFMHVGTVQAQIVLRVPYCDSGLHAIVRFGSAKGFVGLNAMLYSLPDDVLIEKEIDPLPPCPATRLHCKYFNCQYTRGWQGGDVMAVHTCNHITAMFFLLGLVVPVDGPNVRAAADSMLDVIGIRRLLGLCTMVPSMVLEPTDTTLVERVLLDRTCGTLIVTS